MEVFTKNRLDLRAVCLAVLWCFCSVLGADCMAQDKAEIMQSRIDSAAVHFWASVNLSDAALYEVPQSVGEEEGFSAMEEKAAEFFTLLPAASEPAVVQAVNILMDRALEVDLRDASGQKSGSDVYGFFMAAAEKYFYSVESPYYNESLLLHFFAHKIRRTDMAEIEKSREKYLSALIRRNMVGSKAEDFALTMGGRPESLYGMIGQLAERQSVMLVFFSAGCADCIRGITRLKYSAVLSRAVAEGEMAVLAVCTEGNVADVLDLMPDSWAVASDGGSLRGGQLYSMRHTPSVYVLDRNAEVLLKDADVSSAIDFLLR